MHQPDKSDGAAQEDYVRLAAELLRLKIDAAWVPSIACNIQILLTAARVIELPGADGMEPASRFEP